MLRRLPGSRFGARVLSPGPAVLFALLLALVAPVDVAEARRITPALARAVELVRAEASEEEASALRKLFQIQGHEAIPLHRSFVDASLGRDSVAFIGRQLELLRRLRPRRPYLDPIIENLVHTQAELERHGFLNHAPEEPTPSDRLVLDGYEYDADRYRANVRRLSGFEPVRVRDAATGHLREVRLTNRYLGSRENQLADTAAFLKSYYEELGLAVRYEPVTWRGRRAHNVVVTIPGRTRETVVLGAHYDTALDERAPAGVRRAAPGADDDGSGVAALMEAGRALRGHSFEKTIELVHFVGEEMPASTLGSRRFVDALSGSRRQVQAVFILDAIGYNRHGDDRVFLHTDRNERSLFLASEVARAAGRIGTSLRFAGRIPDDAHPVNVRDTDGGPFVRRGTPVVWVAEDFTFRRGIHDAGDRPSALDYTYAGKVVRATLEAAARVARPVDPGEDVRLDRVPPASALGRYRAEVRAGRAGRPPPRDELSDGRGGVRPAYRELARTLAEEPRSRVERAARAMHTDSRDATEFRATPRVVEEAEFAELERGLQQVQRTMQLALADVYSGRSQLLAEGLITRAELEAAEGYDDWYVGAYDRSTSFDFILRPDLVRGQDGRFTVLELNMGFVGGFGDVARIRRLTRAAHPRAFDRVAVHPTEDLPRQLFEHLRSLSPRPNPRIVLTTVGTEAAAGDREDRELVRELRRYGVEYVSARTEKQLVTDHGRVYLVGPRGFRERVDVVYSRGDWNTPEMELAHVNGGVRIFPTPGSSVFEAKNFYKRMPALIRRLLGEEPVFRFLEARSFARPDGTADEAFLAEALRRPERWVFKAANGAQGLGVLVGRDASPEELRDIRARVLRNPAAWDAQEFVEATTLQGERVDLNPYLVTMGGRTFVPRGAMVRTARGRNKFGDNPRFMDTWVLDARGHRDYLRPRTSGPPRTSLLGPRVATRPRAPAVARAARFPRR